MTLNEQVKILRKILDALVNAERYDNDSKEELYDNELAKIKSLPKENILAEEILVPDEVLPPRQV